MIRTAKQLKDKVRNLSGGNSEAAQALIRNYFMERFLERVSQSEYRHNFILKGGMLVASIVGVDMRSTMDIDTTVKALPLDVQSTKTIIEKICAVQLEDGVSFKITSVKEIMEVFEYPGIRMMLVANLERMRQPFKIDISTDDVITPRAINYDYRLMFENRSVSVLSYNLETLLAEKLQTILARGLANTRMRDFYDVYELMQLRADQVDLNVLRSAFKATCLKRKTIFSRAEVGCLLERIEEDGALEEMWNQFKRTNCFVEELSWTDVMKTNAEIANQILE
ncbi:MAG: nucleotidyl transferase AbiEii/AbiGii toxin family protein [Lachnospiraceae bacterium]|nr:nucleotidyl transferase AbiEii/AbiGii toxin family protein [Lachnospiraceae bacterium]